MAKLTAQNRRPLVERAIRLVGIAVLYVAAVALVMFLALATQGYFSF